MTEYERGFIDGIKSKVSAELTPTLINVSRTMLEMLKPVLSTALENVLNDNNAIPAADVQPVKHGHWEKLAIVPATDTGNRILARCSECGDTVFYTVTGREITLKYCVNCGARMMKEG